MPETREQIIERMARAEWGVIWPDSDPYLMGAGFLRATAASLPVAVKAVTDRVREVAQQWAADQKAFRLPRDYSEAISDNTAELLRLLDQIDAELGGDS